MDSFTEEALAQADHVLAMDEFEQFRDNREIILDRVGLRLEEIHRKVRSERDPLILLNNRHRGLMVIGKDIQVRVDGIPLWRRLTRAAFTHIGSMVLLTAGIRLSWVGLERMVGATGFEYEWATVAGLSSIVVASLMYFYVRGWRHLRSDDEAFSRLAQNYLRSLQSEIQKAVSVVINEERDAIRIAGYAAPAPRLVELSAADAIPSRTYGEVKEFIEEHESSAIGIAGTRGSGKTTLLQYLKAQFSGEQKMVVIPFAVHYDTKETMTRILREVAESIAGPYTSTRRQHPFRSLRYGKMFGLAVALVFLISTGGKYSGMIDMPSYWTIDTMGSLASFLMLEAVQAVFIVAIASAVAALIVLLLIAVNRLGYGDSLWRPKPREVREALGILESLDWELERTTKAKMTVKIRSFFQASGEEGLTRRAREQSKADLAEKLDRLCQSFLSGRDNGKMVIGIDELDKLADPEKLIEVVNELKDLFHAPGVHFVVVVSTDSLQSFAKRGLASRDAFDSSFDIVIHTSHFKMQESLNLIKSRATTLPREIAMFCHAWAGGLARELLRNARRAYALQRAEPTVLLPLHRIIDHVVIEDLSDAITASMRTLEYDDPQIDDLWVLHNRVSADRDLSVLSAVAETSPETSFKSPELQALQAKAQLGLKLRRLARELDAVAVDAVPAAADERYGHLRIRLEDIAAAVGALSEPAPIREAAVARALG